MFEIFAVNIFLLIILLYGISTKKAAELVSVNAIFQHYIKCKHIKICSFVTIANLRG